MKFLAALFAVAVLAFPLYAQSKPKPTAKAAPTAKPTPTGPPPGYEVAKFVLPQPSYRSGAIDMRDTTAPDLKNFRRRGPGYLPTGSANAALHKPVASSDDAPFIGDVALITDGEKGAEDGRWVEFGPGTQWVQIDLQKGFNFHGILLWHYHGESRVYRDVIIRLSDDADFTKNVRTVYNNDDNNSSGFGKGANREFYENVQGEWIPIHAQKARYVRLYSRGNTTDSGNQYIEVEVWATPAKTAVTPVTKSASARTHVRTPARFLMPVPQYLDLASMAKKAEAARRKRITNFPVDLPPAPKTAPPGYEVAKFRLPSPPYVTGPRWPDASKPTALFQKRGPVYLPKGSANVALHKPVTSSDDTPIIGALSQITDGEKDASEGYWVELGFGGSQWVQIDLQKSFDIHGVLLWHYWGESRVYFDVVIQLSNDVDFVKGVRTVYNNDQDNSSGLGPGKDREYYESRQGGWIPIQAQKARYVRLYSRGNTSDPQNQYIEVEVWATPTKKP